MTTTSMAPATPQQTPSDDGGKFIVRSNRVFPAGQPGLLPLSSSLPHHHRSRPGQDDLDTPSPDQGGGLHHALGDDGDDKRVEKRHRCVNSDRRHRWTRQADQPPLKPKMDLERIDRTGRRRNGPPWGRQ